MKMDRQARGRRREHLVRSSFMSEASDAQPRTESLGRDSLERENAFDRKFWAYVALVALVALVVRLIYIHETRDVPFVAHLVGDAAGYFAWAERIAAGDWIGSEAFYQAPLYPYVLAVVRRVFGGTVATVRIVQAVWGTLAVVVLCVVGGRLFGRRVGIVSGGMLALYAPAVFFDGVVQKASLGCVLLCLLLLTLVTGVRRRSFVAAGAIGLALGLLILTRENAMVWLPVVGLWMALSWRQNEPAKMRFGVLAGLAVGVAMVLVPVGVRNIAVSGQWSMSTFQSGPNFYIGNHRGADGRYQPLVRGHETPEYERADAKRLAEAATGRPMTARDVSRYWWARSWDDVRADPVAWLGLVGRKFAMVINRYEVSDAESMIVYADHSLALRVLANIWHFGTLCPLAAVGVWLMRRRWRGLWVYGAMFVSMVLAVAIFFVLARYRYPLVPLLIPFAAVGLVELFSLVSRRRWRDVVATCSVLVVAACIVNVHIHDERRLDALARMNVGVALAERGDLQEAIVYFRDAAAGCPESAEANNNLAQSLAMSGDFIGSIEHYRRALDVDPTLMGVAFNLAVALEQTGATAESLSYYERALAMDPHDQDARAAIARLRSRP